LFDFRDDLLKIRVAERHVFTGRDDFPGAVLAKPAADIFNRNALSLEIFEEDEVCGLRINVIASNQIKLLLPLGQKVVDRRRSLLINCFSGVEDVF
jgi:hypothetical protein